jgi:hypothetical protein
MKTWRSKGKDKTMFSNDGFQGFCEFARYWVNVVNLNPFCNSNYDSHIGSKYITSV